MTAWPVLRRYDADHSLRIALPLGGIGTGTVSLGGRGDLRDWEIMNRPAKGSTPRDSFFAIRAGDTVRALEGPIDPVLYEGWQGAAVANHSLPRFAHSEFLAAYPLGQVQLDDPALPVSVRLQAFNPLVPVDLAASSIPVAVLRYVVTNTGTEPLDVTVAGSVRNIVGTAADTDRYATSYAEPGIDGVLLTARGDEQQRLDERWGSLALAVLDEADVSVRTAWAGSSWGGPLLDFWDDLGADGRLDERPTDGGEPVASVAAQRTLQPGGTHAFTFLLAWHFPNRHDWHDTTIIGNHYTGVYSDARDVVARTAPELPDLEERTVGFIDALAGTDLPPAVVEAALNNVSTLRTQTCFRTPDGWFFGWEGCHDDSGSCYGNCTHVWNYELTTPYLFGELARSMRELEFRYATADDGHMSFRLELPLNRARAHGVAAADGQMGCVVKLYREWRLSGDDDLLRSLWPAARKALEFAWIPGGWDADRDGVMEGSQHNTMDVEYFGPNPEVGTWYLAALRAATEMARHLGDEEFAATCADLFTRGSAWIDEHLFNGEYYRHEVRPPGSEDAIAPGLRLPGIGARDLAEPELQIGDGCLTDQLVGQNLAHLTGLGHLLDPENMRTTLRSIMRHNDRTGPAAEFNPKRSYTLADEPGLVVASYPRGNRPARPFPYFAEVWTGLEYTAAIGMVQAGLTDDGVRVVETVRGRFDGRRRNPFDEAECGHHYVRAMAAWGAVVALTGFDYDGRAGALRFAAAGTERVRWFWSSGDAWGTVTQERAGDGVEVVVEVRGGRLRLRSLAVTGVGAVELAERTLTGGDAVQVTVAHEAALSR